MSLLHSPVVLPPPRDRVAELTRENDSLRAEIRELKVKLQREEERSGAVEEGAGRLRAALHPLYIALQQVFGDLDVMGISGADVKPQQSQPPRVAAVWESWKQKLGGKQAEFITVLLEHGEMTATQLKIATKSGQQTVYDTIHKLNKAGLINKNGGKFSLKEL